MGQRQDHRVRVIEDHADRLVDHPEAHQTGIDHAVVAEDDLPGEDAQQIAGPERYGNQDQPDHLVPRHPEGDEIRHRIGEQDGGDCHHSGNPHRLEQQRRVDRKVDADRPGDGKRRKLDAGNLKFNPDALEKFQVVGEGQRVIDIEVVLCPEAVCAQQADRQRERQQHDTQRRRQERKTAQRLVAQEDRPHPLVERELYLAQRRGWRGPVNHYKKPPFSHRLVTCRATVGDRHRPIVSAGRATKADGTAGRMCRS